MIWYRTKSRGVNLYGLQIFVICTGLRPYDAVLMQFYDFDEKEHMWEKKWFVSQ